jgi:(p)ppGpp synthase/HD superfamily hydrolase
MLSNRYKDALMFAAKLHDRQTRKGTQVAYLTHLMSVSALVLENGGDEEQGIAALLHDALEDQGADYESDQTTEPRRGRPALKRDIERRYGSRVLDIVIGCTDDEDFTKPAASELGSLETWRVRKQAYIEHIDHTADVGILRVACADKLHNARTIFLDLHEQGDAVWPRFRSRNKDNLVWYYRSLAAAFSANANATGDPVLKRLCAELDRTVELIEKH